MSDVETVERMIAAPPEKIFAIIADPSRHHEFDGSGTVRDATQVPTEVGLGAKFGMSMKLGIPYSMENTIIEYEPGRRIAWQTRPPQRWAAKLLGGRIWRYELEPVDGGTEVTESFDWSTSRLPLAIELAGYPKRHPAAMDATLARLAALVES